MRPFLGLVTISTELFLLRDVSNKKVKFVGKCILYYRSSSYKDKVKVKFTLEQAVNAQRGSRVIALLFL